MNFLNQDTIIAMAHTRARQSYYVCERNKGLFMSKDSDHMNQRLGFIDKAVDYFKYHQDQANKAISLGDDSKLSRHELKMEKLSEQIGKAAEGINSIMIERNNK